MSEGEQQPQPGPEPAPPGQRTITRRTFVTGALAAGATAAVTGFEVKTGFFGRFLNGNKDASPVSEDRVAEPTPAERLEAAGLGEFQDLWKLYEHYNEVYGDVVKRWPVTGENGFPVMDKLIGTLSSIANNEAGATESGDTKLFASEWGTKKNQVEDDARARIENIGLVTKTSIDPRTEDRFRTSLIDLVPIVPEALMGSSKSFALDRIQGASYSPEKITINHSEYQYLQGKYYVLHEIMHSIMNDVLPNTAPYIDKKEFADFANVYFSAVAKTADEYFDAPYEQIAGPRGLILNNLPGESEAAEAQVRAYEELLSKYPTLISSGDLAAAPAIVRTEDRRYKAVLRYNQLAQIAGRTWRHTQRTDPNHSFLTDTEGFMQHIFDDIAHRYVVDHVRLNTVDRSVFTAHHHDVWNAFLRTFSTIGPDADNQKFIEAIDLAELRNTRLAEPPADFQG